jgi:hypothetical protein
MTAGFVSLAFNPAAWIVAAVIALGSFSGGVVKGWNASNADYWQKQAAEFKKAAEQKERLQLQDAARAEIDRYEHAREKAELEKIIEESRNPGACKLSDAERNSLYDLAAGRGGNSVALPSARR